MKAGILSVGTELLMGQTVNTNASYLSKKMADIGIGVYYHSTVGDNAERITKALMDLMETCDIIVTTGGLGPTLDDITKEVIANALGLNMKLDQRSLTLIRERFNSFNRVMPENNIRQAYFPEGAIILDNEQGTAPACIIEIENRTKSIIILPGPPRELYYLYDKYIKTYLENKNTQKMFSKYLSIYDLGESALEEVLMDLIETQTNPTIATYAGEGKVLLRITSSGLSMSQNESVVNDMVNTVKDRIGKFIVSENGEDIDAVVMDLMKKNGLKIALAESCTGGKLTGTLVKYAGASDMVDSGIVTYSNRSKMSELGVKSETLQLYGAVSHQTCYEMAKGIVEKTGAEIGISVTGIAGPTGGSDEKPVGLVYIGLNINGEIYTFENHFVGSREVIQNRTVIKALKLLYDSLIRL